MLDKILSFLAKFSNLRFWWIYTVRGPLITKVTFLSYGLCAYANVCASSWTKIIMKLKEKQIQMPLENFSQDPTTNVSTGVYKRIGIHYSLWTK